MIHARHVNYRRLPYDEKEESWRNPMDGSVFRACRDRAVDDENFSSKAHRDTRAVQRRTIVIFSTGQRQKRNREGPFLDRNRGKLSCDENASTPDVSRIRW